MLYIDLGRLSSLSRAAQAPRTIWEGKWKYKLLAIKTFIVEVGGNDRRRRRKSRTFFFVKIGVLLEVLIHWDLVWIAGTIKLLFPDH